MRFVFFAQYIEANSILANTQLTYSTIKIVGILLSKPRLTEPQLVRFDLKY
mgnify:CR=1 FL=1|jgi:hypothetical protein